MLSEHLGNQRFGGRKTIFCYTVEVDGDWIYQAEVTANPICAYAYSNPFGHFLGN